MTGTSRNNSEPQTILVVDGEILVRLTLADYLRDCGYKVIEAINAAEVVVVLQSDVTIDIVLSDLHLPGPMNGFGLVKWVRDNRPHLPVILASNPEKAAEAAGSLCDSGPLLARPYEPQTVVDRIKRTLGEAQRRKPGTLQSANDADCHCEVAPLIRDVAAAHARPH